MEIEVGALQPPVVEVCGKQLLKVEVGYAQLLDIENVALWLPEVKFCVPQLMKVKADPRGSWKSK